MASICSNKVTIPQNTMEDLKIYFRQFTENEFRKKNLKKRNFTDVHDLIDDMVACDEMEWKLHLACKRVMEMLVQSDNVAHGFAYLNL